MEADIALNYNAYRTPRGNIIWCGTLALAWQQLVSSQHLQSLEFKTQNPQALKIIRNFNQTLFKAEDVSPQSIYLKAGMGPATLTAINKQVKEKFIRYSFPDLDYKLGEMDIISFSYLSKQLTFSRKFEKRRLPTFRFNGKQVQSFFAEGESQKKQVKAGYYRGRDDFLIRVGDKRSNDLMYLVKKEESLTVDQIIEEVQAAEKECKFKHIKKSDQFEMPLINLEHQENFTQLIGLPFSNPELQGYSLAVIMEAVKLKVDETGAKLESRAVVVADRCRESNPDPPRHFILDKTFWLVMKESGRHPFLLAEIVEPTEV